MTLNNYKLALSTGMPSVINMMGKFFNISTLIEGNSTNVRDIFRSCFYLLLIWIRISLLNFGCTISKNFRRPGALLMAYDWLAILFEAWTRIYYCHIETHLAIHVDCFRWWCNRFIFVFNSKGEESKEDIFFENNSLICVTFCFATNTCNFRAGG